MQDNSYLSNYEEIEYLGKNFQDDSTLYLIKDRHDSKYKMAKKIAIFEAVNGTEDQMLNQVKVIKDLEHPHVLKYYDVCLEGDELISILEFCEEGDMKHYLEKRKNRKEMLSEKLIISWLMQILMGLEYIHSKNIVHRLISSHNIYMNHQGDLKIGSFGAAKLLENTISKAMTVVNEPCYICPEMVESKPYDCKADIWALGCLIYEMTSFQHPFKLNSLPQLYDAIIKQPCPDLPFKYSKYLAPIYKKMLKKNPQSRPTASELLQEDVFFNLMKEYSKKKKIDALDLRQIVPKQLGIHRKRKTKGQKNSLPPLTPSRIKEMKNEEKTSKSRVVEKAPPLKNNRRSCSRERKGEKVSVGSPPLKKDKQSEPVQLPKSPKTPKITQKKQNKEDQIEEMIEKQADQRITSPDLTEADYISYLCEIKLQILSKKYQPNMSKIFERTIEFDDLY